MSILCLSNHCVLEVHYLRMNYNFSLNHIVIRKLTLSLGGHPAKRHNPAKEWEKCICLTRDHHKWFGVTKTALSYFPSLDSTRECLQPSPHLLWNHRLACKGSMGWEAAKTEYPPQWYCPMSLYKLQYHQKNQETLQVEGVEKREPLYPVGENVNLYSHYGKQHRGCFKN